MNTARFLVAVLIGCLAPACNDRAPQSPVLCILAAGDALDGCPATGGASAIHDGDAFYVVHQLPAGVEPPCDVHVHVETPCTVIDREMSYAAPAAAGVGQVAIGSFVAPPGAACALVVTATIANSTLTRTIQTDPGACADVAAACTPGAADGG
jgi:hypothetical protein